jgi:hypothetical protein
MILKASEQESSASVEITPLSVELAVGVEQWNKRVQVFDRRP